MAYRFSGTTDQVKFAIAPFNGYTVGALTLAIFMKRNATGGDDLVGIHDSTGASVRSAMYFNSSNVLVRRQGANCAGPSLTSTSVWYLIVSTLAAGISTPRWHVHDGTSWSHSNADRAVSSNPTIGGTDIQFVSSGGFAGFLSADVVCVAAKKADASDATVETLSRTAWSAWTSYGFDWLIGFDSSLEAAGILQDQASPGTGDEVAITGTTAVADPAGWSWAGAPAAPAFVPQIVIA